MPCITMQTSKPKQHERSCVMPQRRLSFQTYTNYPMNNLPIYFTLCSLPILVRKKFLIKVQACFFLELNKDYTKTRQHALIFPTS